MEVLPIAVNSTGLSNYAFTRMHCNTQGYGNRQCALHRLSEECMGHRANYKPQQWKKIERE